MLFRSRRTATGVSDFAWLDRSARGRCGHCSARLTRLAPRHLLPAPRPPTFTDFPRHHPLPQSSPTRTRQGSTSRPSSSRWSKKATPTGGGPRPRTESERRAGRERSHQTDGSNKNPTGFHIAFAFCWLPLRPCSFNQKPCPPSGHLCAHRGRVGAQREAWRCPISRRIVGMVSTDRKSVV